MPVSPRDIISINSPFYVHAVKSEKTLNGKSLSVSGIFPDGQYYEDYPMREDELDVLQEEASEYDVRKWFDREYRLHQLDRAIFASGEYEAVAYYHYRRRSAIPRHRLSLLLTDRKPANTISSLLLDAKNALIEARDWVLKKRHECLGAFAERYADYLTESSEESLNEVLDKVYAEMFSFEKGKPLCLPFLAEECNIYGKTYEECAARLMEVTLEMMFDINKSISYVEWVHGELNTFYDELARELDPACWEVVEKLSI